MPKTLREILDDNTAFKDDVKFSLGEGVEATLGDLRALDKARREELDGQAKVLDQAATAIAQLYEKAEAAAKGAQPAQPAATAQPAQTGNTDLENDPLFAPMFKQVRSLESKLNDFSSQFDKVPKTIESLVKLYENDRMQTVFESLADRPENLTVEGLAQYALDNGIKDRLNRLDLKRAYREMRRPDVERQRAQQEYERGLQEGKKSAFVETAPKPRFSKPAAEANAKRPGSVRDAFDNMRGDNKLMADLNEALAGLSTVQ